MNSSVLKWPSRETVENAVRRWSARQAKKRPEVVRIGYFGSYARGDWGVGSDLDLIAVVDDTSTPFERRGAEWDLNDLPVPSEILVYSSQEWDRLLKENTKFSRVLNKEVVWILK